MSNPDSSIPRYVCKKAPKGHKRSVSDTAVLLQKDLYLEIQPGSAPANAYPKPQSSHQSWFDYVQSGKFQQAQQTTLDKENAHLVLAETVIYCHHQTRKSPIKVDLPQKQEEGLVKVNSSAEHLLLLLLSMFENPHAIKAYEALKLLRERGDPLAKRCFEKSYFQNPTSSSCCWKPAPTNADEMILLEPPKPKGRHDGLSKQNWLCYICGIPVEEKYSTTFRYCFYFGKYCCRTCHQNDQHILPANILSRWNFRE